MSTQNKISFTSPTTNDDGSPITEALSFAVQIDTVNPPVKSFFVPAANVAAAVAGVVTATFSDLGFVPVHGTDYFAAATAVDADGTSNQSAVVPFKFLVVPNAPTNLVVG